jgi:hypothetical protein
MKNRWYEARKFGLASNPLTFGDTVVDWGYDLHEEGCYNYTEWPTSSAPSMGTNCTIIE